MFIHITFIYLTLLLLIGSHPSAQAGQSEYSSTIYGSLGLNTVPSARMAKAGTITAGFSTLDPYAHAYIGFQLADPLYVSLRQSAEISHFSKAPDRLYPGIDIKLRLIKEGDITPEIAIGLQSVIGHKRMAGEYIAASKRYNDFDFTLGLGWGRLGSAGNIKNPFSDITHFSKKRDLDGENPNQISDLFTGEDIGIFGGLEYFTPYDGLSLKLDFGADRYIAEKAAFNFDAPAPWSAGVSYKPAPWINMGLAMQGTSKILGQISLQSTPAAWPFKPYKDKQPTPMRYHRTTTQDPAQIALFAKADDILLYDISNQGKSAHATLALSPSMPTPMQVGHALRHMANHSGPNTEELNITPTLYNMHGPTLRIIRKDIENALITEQGSPEEIWQNTTFTTFTTSNTKKKITNASNPAHIKSYLKPEKYSLTLENDLSLSEEDHGSLYRTSLLIGTTLPKFFGLLTSGSTFRINIKDNLSHLKNLRPTSPLPVRSNVNEFANNTFGMENGYTSFTHSFRPDTHIVITQGYLEEMYAGAGGEIIHRPFKSRFTIGAEGWLAFKRDPNTTLNLGFNGDRVLTGHVKAWYDIPQHDLTLQGRFGRYLNEDIGATLSLSKDFKNGASIESYLTVTNQAETDLFGGSTHADHGIRLSLPLGSVKYMPETSKATLNISPFGRDIGQILKSPMPLYEITKPFSYQHIVKNWDGIVE